MRIFSRTFYFILRHENWCLLAIFLLLVGFVDSNSLWERHFVWENTAALKSEIRHYNDLYIQDSLSLVELKTNPRRLEQVARERYLMCREDEDVFLIQYGDQLPRSGRSEGEPLVDVGH